MEPFAKSFMEPAKHEAHVSIAAILEELGADTQTAIDAARDAVFQVSSKYYAVARWVIEDIHKLRCDEEGLRWDNFGDRSDWSDEQCETFMVSIEDQLQDEAIMKGWEVLSTLYSDRMYYILKDEEVSNV